MNPEFVTATNSPTTPTPTLDLNPVTTPTITTPKAVVTPQVAQQNLGDIKTNTDKIIQGTVSQAQMKAVGAQNQAQYNQIVAQTKAANDAAAAGTKSTDKLTGAISDATKALAPTPAPTPVQDLSHIITGTSLDGSQIGLTPGTKYVYQGNNQFSTYDANGNASTVTVGNPATSTGTDTTGTSGTNYTGAINSTQQKIDDANTQFQQVYNQILTGTFPLNSSQQAILDSTKASFDRAIAAQNLANANQAGGINITNITSGRSRYAPEMALGLVQQVASAGAQKIADLDSQASQQLATLQQGFMDSDYKLISDSYDKLTSYLNQKTTELQKMQDTANQAIKDAQARIDKENASIQDIATTAAKNGASPAIIAKIVGTTNVGDAITAAGDSLQTATGQLGDYLQYKRDAQANNQIPTDYATWKAADDKKQSDLKISEAYGTAFATAKGKAAGEATSSNNVITSPVVASTGVANGLTFNAPASIAPYVSFAANGVKYVDMSNFKGTPTEANQAIQDAQNAGYKVITNKNTALDVQNIADALGKLEDMRAAFNSVSPATAAARDTWQSAWIKAATALQADPNAASNDVYVASALDILKALSGVQGFRGGQSIVQTVESIFPSNTNTQAVNNQKIDKLQQLIDTRQQALVGKPSASDQLLIDANNADKTVTTGLTNIKTTNPTLYQAASSMYLSTNPTTGQPYTAQDILQAFPELQNTQAPPSAPVSSSKNQDFIDYLNTH